MFHCTSIYLSYAPSRIGSLGTFQNFKSVRLSIKFHALIGNSHFAERSGESKNRSVIWVLPPGQQESSPQLNPIGISLSSGSNVAKFTSLNAGLHRNANKLKYISNPNRPLTAS
jgi:hypothetical protein